MGIAYKHGVPYTVGSQALKIATKLSEYDVKILVYDPFVDESDMPSFIKLVEKGELIENSDVIFIGQKEYSASSFSEKIMVNPWK